MKILQKIKYKMKYKDCIIDPSSYIDEKAILKKCRIARNCDIRNGVEIGEHSYVNCGSNIISGKIGRYCSIGYNVEIGAFEHPIHFISTSPEIYKIVEENYNELKNPPVIMNDVWIGSKAIVLQGVKIGNGAIIAAGAVVTKDVPSYAIVAGVPARIIKYRFSEDIIKKIENTKWWDNEESWIDTNKKKFTDIEDFMEVINSENQDDINRC